MLDEHGPNADHEIVEFVIVGRKPEDAPWEEIKDTLASINARLLTYDELIDEAFARYEDYVEANRKLANLEDTLARLETEEPVEDGA